MSRRPYGPGGSPVQPGPAVVREREIVYERHHCECGCGGDWTLPEARAELDKILAR